MRQRKYMENESPEKTRILAQFASVPKLATRTYAFRSLTESFEVTVEIRTPIVDPETGRYICLLTMCEPGYVAVRPMSGDDALESLLLAISLARFDLELILRMTGATVTWANGQATGLGFDFIGRE
jgi:hypothetical protein